MIGSSGTKILVRGMIDFLIITDIIKTMKKNQFPIIVEKGEDGFYVVECPIFHGCISQGKTLDDAIKNIKEAIELCLEEKENKEIIKSYKPTEISLHAITL